MEDKDMIKIMVDGEHIASVRWIKEAQDLCNYFLYNGIYPLFAEAAIIYDPKTKETCLSCFSYEGLEKLEEVIWKSNGKT